MTDVAAPEGERIKAEPDQDALVSVRGLTKRFPITRGIVDLNGCRDGRCRGSNGKCNEDAGRDGGRQQSRESSLHPMPLVLTGAAAPRPRDGCISRPRD